MITPATLADVLRGREAVLIRYWNLFSAAGPEQIERALWWAGPDEKRLLVAAEWLAEGCMIDADGRWQAPPEIDVRALGEELKRICRNIGSRRGRR